MKQETNRRSRKVVKRLYVKSRRFLRKDGNAVIAVLSVLTLGLSLTSTASAISVPDSSVSDDSQVIAEQIEAPGEFTYRTLPGGEQFTAALPVKLGAQPSMLTKTLETTSGATQETKKTTTTTTTTSAVSTTSAAETQFETETETEAETEYESETTETVAWDEAAEEETVSESVNEVAEGSVYDYVSEDEIIMLAKTVAQEGGDCSYTQQACVIWTVLNRVDSWEWPNTIAENLTMDDQFAYYSWKPYRDDHYQVAYDQVYNWLFGGERYLGSDYQYFYGDGWRNHFYGKNSSEYVPD